MQSWEEEPHCGWASETGIGCQGRNVWIFSLVPIIHMAQLLFKSWLLESASLPSMNQFFQLLLLCTFDLLMPSTYSGPSWPHWPFIFQLQFLQLTDLLYTSQLEMSKSKNLFGQGFLCYDTLKTAGWPLDLLLLGPGLTPDPIRNECVCVCVCV